MFVARAVPALSLVLAASTGQAGAPSPAHVKASKELADAEPAIEHEAFKLLQQIDKEKR